MKKIIFFLVLSLTISFGFAEMTVSSVNTASEQLAKKLNSVSTFSSNFTQDVVSEDGQVLQKSIGKIQFNRQGLFYWQVNSSNPQTLWYRDHELIIYDERLEQATVKKVYSINDPNLLPLMLLTGDAATVLTHFSVTQKASTYFLKPLKADHNELLVNVILELADDGSIRMIEYQTSLGQMTKIIFDHPNVNKSLNDALFFTSLPVGTDIVMAE